MYDEYDKFSFNSVDEPPKKTSVLGSIIDLPGTLIGWVFAVITSLFKTIRNFCYEHKRAIAIACWITIGFIAAGVTMALAFSGPWGVVVGALGLAAFNVATQVTLWSLIGSVAANLVCLGIDFIYNCCCPVEKEGPRLYKPSAKEVYGDSSQSRKLLKPSNFSYVNPDVHHESPLSISTKTGSTNPFDAEAGSSKPVSTYNPFA